MLVIELVAIEELLLEVSGVGTSVGTFDPLITTLGVGVVGKTLVFNNIFLGDFFIVGCDCCCSKIATSLCKMAFKSGSNPPLKDALLGGSVWYGFELPLDDLLILTKKKKVDLLYKE